MVTTKAYSRNPSTLSTFSDRLFSSRPAPPKNDRFRRAQSQGRSLKSDEPGFYPHHRIVPPDHYVFTANKLGIPDSRIVVRDRNDPSVGREYGFNEHSGLGNRKVFHCITCLSSKRVPVSVYDVDGEIQVREALNERHFLKCVPKDFNILLDPNHDVPP